MALRCGGAYMTHHLQWNITVVLHHLLWVTRLWFEGIVFFTDKSSHWWKGINEVTQCHFPEKLAGHKSGTENTSAMSTEAASVQIQNQEYIYLYTI